MPLDARIIGLDQASVLLEIVVEIVFLAGIGGGGQRVLIYLALQCQAVKVTIGILAGLELPDFRIGAGVLHVIGTKQVGTRIQRPARCQFGSQSQAMTVLLVATEFHGLAVAILVIAALFPVAKIVEIERFVDGTTDIGLDLAQVVVAG